MSAARRKRLLNWLGVAAGLVVFGAAKASTLQVDPVSVRLTPQTRSAVMRLRNDGAEAVHVQVRAFRWQQQDGEDRLSATDALRVSPPIQAIPPGGEQIVRVLLAENLAPQAEETFRLIVDELPGAPASNGRVRMLIRYSVPVTVRPDNLAPASLHFRLERGAGAPVLEARNSGGQSAQLSALRLTASSGNLIEVSSGLLGYVLPGQIKRWELAATDVTGLERVDGIAASVDGKPGAYSLENLP
jgi:fimbrial chaperone protein